MKKLALITSGVAALALSACAPTYGDDVDSANVAPDDIVYVGNAAMYPNRTIVQNASEADNLTTLVSLVQQAGLVDTLNSAGPFTVFAPTDDAFSRVPAATLETLQRPERRELLQKVLTYHVVPGRVNSADLVAQINANGGTYMAETVAGEQLTFTLKNGNVRVAGKGGSYGFVTTADVMQSNGVVHVVNGVLTPTL